jgi:hypothetical protein
MHEHLAVQVDDYTAGRAVLFVMGSQIFVIVCTEAYSQTAPDEAVVYSAYPHLSL